MNSILQTEEDLGVAHPLGKHHDQMDRPGKIAGVHAALDDRLRSNDPAKLYRDEVGRVELLSTEEVVRLAQRIERGREAAKHPERAGHRQLIEDGEQAKRQLIEANLRLVIHIAKRYKGMGVDLMDLIQEGNLGLMHAVEKFDYTKGYRFSTYATWWIRQAIARALTEQLCSLHVPLYKVEMMKRMERIRRHMLEELEREPTQDELTSQMEISVEQMADLLTITQEPISLDIFRRFGDDSVPLSELLEDDRSDSPEQVVIAQTLEVQIRDLLNSLTNRERQVIRLRYGLDGSREHTLHEIGRKLGLSHEAVRQVESRALHKLDPLSRTRELNDFLDK